VVDWDRLDPSHPILELAEEIQEIGVKDQEVVTAVEEVAPVVATPVDKCPHHDICALVKR
jgi:hypothetical protein